MTPLRRRRLLVVLFVLQQSPASAPSSSFVCVLGTRVAVLTVVLCVDLENV